MIFKLSTLLFATCAHLALGHPTNNDLNDFKITIVGGSETKPHQYPFIVDIRIIWGGTSSHSCGGSIISKDWIVTAAHCTSYPPDYFEVVAGDHNIYREEGTEQRRQVVQIVSHAKFHPGTYENDIALMKVTPPFELNEHVGIAELAKTGYSVNGHVTAVGWGRLAFGGASPDTLRHVDVPFVNDTECRRLYGSSVIKDSMLCAGHPNGGKDACQGDSGGPLSHAGAVVGITSFGLGCANAAYPGVYTEVSYFREWISAALRNDTH